MSGVDRPIEATSEQTSFREESSPELLSKVFFLSFKFSQGKPALQQDILQYVHNTYPDWTMTDALRDQVYALVNKPIRDIIRPARMGKLSQKPVRHQSSLGSLWMLEDEDTIRGELETMQKVFNGDLPIPENLVGRIAKEIILRDYYFLSREGGRERFNIPEGEKHHPANDPFLSHFFHYGSLRRPTGVPAFDEMFQQVAAYTHANVQEFDEGLKEKLSFVSGIHNQHHPDNPVTLFM